MTKFYSVPELSEILGLSKYTIREWFRVGELKGVKIGKHWRMSEEDFEAYLKEKHG